MSDRVVKVVLQAKIDGFKAGMAQARKDVADLKGKLDQTASAEQALNFVGGALLGVGAAAAAGVGLAVSKWAEFDQAMSAVKAATHESDGAMRQLEATALEAGAATVFSATEAANAIEELAKAGVSTKDILSGGLTGALDLAAAGGLGVADAAGIAATALQTFQLKGSEMPHVADLLAAGAGKAMGEVTDLSMALNQSSMVAHSTGLSIEETTGALSAFASQGLLGSDAGTSFKTMLMALSKETGPGAERMKELGISAFDAQGKFVGLSEFAGQLETKLAKMTDQQRQATLNTIFGSDAIRAATVLYSEGASGVQGWIDKVNDTGFASKTAADRLDNLRGDLEALGGSLDTALIQTGSTANDTLRTMVQWVSGAVDSYNEMPPALQGVTMGAGLLTAAVGLTGGAFLLAVPKVAEYRAALATLGSTAQRTSRVLGMVGKGAGALALVALGIEGVTAAIESMKVSTQDLENTIKQGNSALEAMDEKLDATVTVGRFSVATDAATGFRKALDSVAEHGNDWWSDVSKRNSSMNAAVGDIENMGQALASLARTNLPEAQDAFKRFYDEAGLNKKQGLTAINDTMPEFKTALIDIAKESGLATDSASLLKLALGEISPAAEGSAESAKSAASAYIDEGQAAANAADELQKLIDMQNAHNQVGQTVEQTNAAWHQGLADVAEYIEKAQQGLEGFTLSMDASTQAGSANRAMLADQAAKGLDAAEATLQMEIGTLGADKAAANYQQTLAGQHKWLIDTAQQFGLTKKQAEDFANRVHAIPDKKQLDVIVKGAKEAEDALNGIARARNAVIQVITTGQEAGNIVYSGAGGRQVKNANGGLHAYANGGLEAYASGGMAEGVYRGRAGALYKFAEPETRWEAFISGRAGMEARNTSVWADAGNRLGAFDKIAAALAAGQSAPSVQIGEIRVGEAPQRQWTRELVDEIERIGRR